MSGAPRIALVTGGGSGIGAAAAHHLALAGFTVAVTGRRADRLAAVADRIRQSGGAAEALASDISDPASVAVLFAELQNRFGRLDVLFNNAGISGPPVASFDQISVSQWRKVVDTNLNGYFYCSREAFRLMRQQNPRGGRIINNGSISAHAPRPNTAPYTATKHAVTGLTRSIALDGRPYDIACGQIDIGNAATEMTEANGGEKLQAHGATMVEPFMDVEDVGRAVATMATMPPSANVLFMTVMATKMPFVGRG
jgi:NAD(P)-dependent dehydrogenase (short-subunit alcohol dehydrogenase family)